MFNYIYYIATKRDWLIICNHVCTVPAGQQVKNCRPFRTATYINAQNGVKSFHFSKRIQYLTCREGKYSTGNRKCWGLFLAGSFICLWCCSECAHMLILKDSDWGPKYRSPTRTDFTSQLNITNIHLCAQKFKVLLLLKEYANIFFISFIWKNF
jgi:hypothetical protein